MSKAQSLLLGVSIGAILATGAAAQEAEQGRTTFLGPITIVGNEVPTSPIEGTIARSSATTKTGTPIVETQSSVSVVPRALIEAQGATNLAESLNYSAGVVSENFGGDPRFDSLYLRGFNLENDKFLDGLRLMRSTQYPTSAPSFELYGLERVEVLRGPASLLYGAGTPAGLVNMVQKRAQADGDFGELGFGFDSNGSWSIFGDANTVVDDRFAYRLTTKTGNTRTDVEDIDNERSYFGLSASYALTDATELEFMASYHDDAPLSPTGVPGAMIGAVDLKDLRDVYFGDSDLDRSDRKMGTITLGATHDFGNGWKLRGAMLYTKHDWDYDSLYVSGGTADAATRGFQLQRESFTSYGADLRLSGTATTGPVEHNLTFGLDALKFKEDATTEFYYASERPLAGGSGGATVLDRWYNADKTVDAKQTGIYALDELTFGNWRATVGLRHEWTDQSGQSLTNFGNTDFDRDDDQTTGHLALGYRWENGINAYLSYATSYLPQPGLDIAGNPLKPTHGKQIEAGVKYEPTTFDGLFTAAVYELRETDRNTAVVEDGVTGTRQIGEARIKGLELEGAAELADGWMLKGAYTYTSTEVSGDFDGNALKNVPEHAVSLWLSHEFAGKLQGLTLGGGLRHIGSRWGDDANTNRLGSVNLVDLGASYEWQNGLVGRINVNNLTDEAYVAGVGSFATYLGDGRSAQASLTYKW